MEGYCLGNPWGGSAIENSKSETVDSGCTFNVTGGGGKVVSSLMCGEGA